MNYKLSPSDFAFLCEECESCYYLKVIHNYNRVGENFERNWKGEGKVSGDQVKQKINPRLIFQDGKIRP